MWLCRPSKWPRFLSNVSRKLEGSASPKSQNGKWIFNICSSVKFKHHVLFEFYLCIGFWKSAFVVALIWSPGRICATDWSSNYTPTPSRVLQTRNTDPKWLKLEQTMSGSGLSMRQLVFSTQELLHIIRSHVAAWCHFARNSSWNSKSLEEQVTSASTE